MTLLLKPIPCDEFNVLYDMLRDISVPIKTKISGGRGDFGRHRSMTFGITRGRFNGIIGLSLNSKKYPHIYKEIKRIGHLIGGEWNSIHLNHNVICPRHLDANNVGESILVSFGDYTGCNIVVQNPSGEEVKYDAFCQPIKFNGAELVHYNTNDLVGNKYSLVFFTSKYI
jgi:hypothetical protein